SIDGSSGAVYAGEVPVMASPVVEYFEGSLDAGSDELVAAVARIMEHADATRRLGVYANADTGDDCARARRFGARGVGLVRHEHICLGDARRRAGGRPRPDDEAGRQAALAPPAPRQRGTFVEIPKPRDAPPVIIRLTAPPLHEFLPDLTDISVKVALAEKGA